jgi:hypothetical protein
MARGFIFLITFQLAKQAAWLGQHFLLKETPYSLPAQKPTFLYNLLLQISVKI